jgi:hypothetical protein
MNQYFVKYSINDKTDFNRNSTFACSVDVEPKLSASHSTEEILLAVCKKHNVSYMDITGRVHNENIVIEVLTRLN